MFGLKYPLALLGSSPKWNFWSSSHPGAGLGAPEVECEALLPVCRDWQPLRGWDTGSKSGVYMAVHCLASARPKLPLCSHKHEFFWANNLLYSLTTTLWLKTLTGITVMVPFLSRPSRHLSDRTKGKKMKVYWNLCKVNCYSNNQRINIYKNKDFPLYKSLLPTQWVSNITGKVQTRIGGKSSWTHLSSAVTNESSI